MSDAKLGMQYDDKFALMEKSKQRALKERLRQPINEFIEYETIRAEYETIRADKLISHLNRQALKGVESNE